MKKVRVVKSAAFGGGPYGYVDKDYVASLIESNAVLDAERTCMNYYTTRAGKMIHIYNIFELN